MQNQAIKFALATCLLGWVMLGSGCQAQVNPAPKGAEAVAGAAASVAVVEGIAPADAEKMIASTADLQILDVRTPEEVALGVIKGAKVINWFDADFGTRATTTLDKAKPVLVYCKAGGRSAQAADLLQKQGFSKVYNLQGGMTKWEGEGHPVQK